MYDYNTRDWRPVRLDDIAILVPAVLIAGEFYLIGYGKGFVFISLLYLGAAVVEGILTAAIVSFRHSARPALLYQRQ